MRQLTEISRRRRSSHRDHPRTVGLFYRALFFLALIFLIAPAVASAGAPVQFTDVSAAAGVDVVNGGSGGAGWADYDNDGCLDLLVAGSDDNWLYRNNCDGTFTDVTAAAGITIPEMGQSVAWGDYDGDGDLDVYITGRGGIEPNALYRNNGDGTFTERGADAGVDDSRGSSNASWADYDEDGDLDLFVANRWTTFATDDRTDRLYRNDGDGTFTDVAPSLGIGGADDRLTFSGVWADLDENGTVDLYLAVDFGDDVYYYNNGDGTFADRSVEANVNDPQHGMGLAVGDLNNDGCLDVGSTNNHQGDTDPTHIPSVINLSNCDGTFTNSSDAVGVLDRDVVEWGINFVDYDNDGDSDISIVAGGMLSTGEPNVLYENVGGAGTIPSFVDVTAATGTEESGAAFGSAWADYDRDGDLDWFVANQRGTNTLFRNDGPVGNHLKVVLQGFDDNLRGVGSRVDVTAGGVTMARVIQAGLSYLSSEELAAFFGVGTNTTADVTVTWPNGVVDTALGVPVNQTVTIGQGMGVVSIFADGFESGDVTAWSSATP